MFFSRRKKTPIVLQMEATECGIASLCMILGYYGKYISLEEIREVCGVSRNGCKASAIARTARLYGLEARGIRVLSDDIDNIDQPMIIHWDFNHFVVYEGCSKNKKYFYINDPALGPRTVDKETFDKSFTGIALLFNKTANFKKEGKPLSVFSSVLPMLKSTGRVMLSVIWSSLLLVIPGIVIPCLSKIFVDNILPSEKGWFLPVILLFLLMIILQVFLQWLLELSLRKGTVQLSLNKTLGMFRHLMQLPISFFTTRSVADIQNRLSINVSVAEQTFSMVTDNVVRIIVSLLFLSLMIIFSPLLTIIIIGFLSIELLCMFILTKMRTVLNQRLYMHRVKLMNSIVNGIEVFENLKAEGKEDSLFEDWINKFSSYNFKFLRFEILTQYFNIIPTFFSLLSNVVVLCVGAWLIMKGELSIGGMFAFQTLIASFTSPFVSVIQSSTEYMTLKANINSINDVYNYYYEDYFKKEDVIRSEFIKPYASIEFKNVGFSYSKFDNPAITDLSFEVPIGKRIAIVGLSGAGKSTIVKLLSGINRPNSGEILLNGIPYQDYTMREFFSMVGVIDQNFAIFSGTLKDNLSMFDDNVKSEKLIQAIKDAQLFDELQVRGTILSQEINESGSNYSGGQCQRLEIARVLAKNTPLIILDEATSALDTETEKLIDRALRKKGVTQIIVAHRLSTIKDADEILVLDHGKIVERGNHSDLLSLNGMYASLMKSSEN